MFFQIVTSERGLAYRLLLKKPTKSELFNCWYKEKLLFLSCDVYHPFDTVFVC